MKLYLKESKRDDLLLPYFETIRSMGINIQFGEFKSALLQKLSSEAGMHNLSLRSNYYVAGAARYYFNGDLTLNKQVSLLTKEYWEGNRYIQDTWNTDVCQKLDKIILLLRNSYIDSVGSSMELSEDFGNLPINKLLRKYGGKIKKMSDGESKTEPTDTINRNSSVGNGYTFEIMYSQADCQKYERPTAPGSWCITYGKSHYDGYIRRLNIHYVIFRQNGWEDIKRPKDPLSEPGFTKEKPHDAYGNSLIAVLQSNTSPEPVYITSRWNHGREVTCEADHAYTKEEFQQITGVTDEDLKRIYDIWQTDRNKKTNRVSKKEVLNAVRGFKYAQMRINAGENPDTILTKRQFLVGDENRLNKSVSIVSIDVDETRWVALFDRNKIIFETITQNDIQATYTKIGNFVFLRQENKSYMVYNVKRHELLSINGTFKFKYGPGQMFSVNHDEAFSSNKGNMFMMLKQSRHDIVLINVKTCEPLKLPNGEYWFNMCYCNAGYDFGGTNCFFYLEKFGSLLEIIYDMSSGEKYFFDVANLTFIEPPRPDKTMPYFSDINIDELEPILPEININTTEGLCGYMVFQFVYKENIRTVPNTGERYNIGFNPIVLYKHGKIQQINGVYLFSQLDFAHGMILFQKFNEDGFYSIPYVYDIKNNKVLMLCGEYLSVGRYNIGKTSHNGDLWMSLVKHGRQYVVYNTQSGEFYHRNPKPTGIDDYLMTPNLVFGDRGGSYVNKDEMYLGNKKIGIQNIDRNDIENMVSESIKLIIKKMFI